MIERLYHWLWHDLLRLPEPISHLVASSIHANPLIWSLVGSVVLASIWTFSIHLIALHV